VPGRVEALNREAADQLLNPGRTPAAPPPGEDNDAEILSAPPGGF